MQLGVAEPNWRLPYTALPIGDRLEVIRILQQIGLEHVPRGSSIQPLEDVDFNHLDTW